MKFKTIRMRTLMSVLPLVVASMFLLTSISYLSAKSLLNKELDTKMNTQLGQVIESVERNLDKHAAIPMDLAKVAESYGTSITKDNYSIMLKNVITNNTDTLGAGIWYEPYKYNKDIKFFGPYAYKDGDKVVYTDDYATENYNYPNQDWYKGASNTTNKIVWSNPYYDDTTKTTMVTATSPFYDANHKLLGTATGDINITNIQKMVGDVKIGTTGKAILIDNSGLFMAGVPTDKIMKAKVSEDTTIGLKTLATDLLSGKSGNSTYTSSNGKNIVYYTTIPSTKWVVALTIPEAELYAPLNSLLVKLSIITIISILISIVVVVLFSIYISKNLKNANVISQSIAEGDFSKNIEVTSEDEIGMMYTNLNTMSSKLKDVLIKVSQNLENVVATSEELTASADQTQMASEKIALSMQDIAEGSDVQLNSSEDAVKIVEDISLKIHHISDNVQDVSKTSIHALETAEKGEQVIGKVKSQMATINKNVVLSSRIVNELGGKSNSIGEIVSLITNIATQTDLLALNAAIEAARAGEQGKGFAVVADEVRKLAEQSGDAAEQIGSLIVEIQNEISNAINIMNEGTTSVKDGILIVNDAKNSFDDINNAINEVSGKANNVTIVISEIYTATKEMSEAIEKISKISQDSTGNTQTVAAAAEEQSALMKEVANAAESLTNMAIDLQNNINFFKF
ncbi:methyl-accepting chemotaxis sensory transducer with Cache sensor [Clostridium cavendishii DSM 21758]|uniref:Methyl-accepting chemotaxis sensory transducer with Cache sensor n=1 Tax=Clostridium cavendishii DSM 21758 TaxID=1121302 RepID=A0A1M6D7V7_9CLOT|nr:methyl-accepting chemotaxis protein [Clostridium cavendishii]SHI69295.1 methyl-accepting chemotaxis sensory transducer with Cache sensor [Clostridium cavendishii DSM 21758]